jgi:predicted membrane channel-forming protein YqfA (hemolysin III family)
MELALSICLGIGLSAACGFRVFVPLLGMSFAANAGHIELSEGFDWIATWPAFACFLTATLLEIAAYYIPWLDNLLDNVATPIAIIAGTLITAAVITDMSPLMKWSLALIAGGGTAGIIQASTITLRGASSLTTGGFANFLIASGELAASVATTALSVILPVVTAVGIVVLIAVLLFSIRRRFRNAERGSQTV